MYKGEPLHLKWFVCRMLVLPLQGESAAQPLLKAEFEVLGT